jgi:gamma-glutamyltranspeptidase/glutathione hydrolase
MRRLFILKMLSMTPMRCCASYPDLLRCPSRRWRILPELLFGTICIFLSFPCNGCSPLGPLFSKPKIAHGTNAGVATAHPLATKTAAYVLSSGGNAIDAAVAASFVLAVVRPQSTGIGGGGFLLYHNQIDGTTHAFDFRERAPGELSRKRLANGSTMGVFRSSERASSGETCAPKSPSADGHRAVGTPGLVKGLWQIHDRFGRLPFGALLRPAIHIASNGFRTYPSFINAIKSRSNVLSCFDASRKLFLPNGKPPPEGTPFIQTDLARTLTRIADYGASDFYDGEIAQAINAEMFRGDGVLNSQDLHSYSVVERKPLNYTHNGLTFKMMPPPSAGGVLLKELLVMTAQLQEKGVPLNSLEWNGDGLSEHYLTEIMKRAFADRALHLGDPKSMTVDVKTLTDSKTLAAWTNLLSATKATPYAPSVPSLRESPSTTHISIIDNDGNAVSSTQTINVAFGSGVVVPHTGIVLNNEIDDFWTGAPNSFRLVGNLPNAVEGDKTPLSSMSPTLVLDHNKIRLAIGSPGGPRIISSVYLMLFHHLIRGASVGDSIILPRIHHQWSPNEVYVESQDPDVSSGLAARGHTIGESAMYFGDVQLVEKVSEDEVIAVSDPRSDGVPWAE